MMLIALGIYCTLGTKSEVALMYPSNGCLQPCHLLDKQVTWYEEVLWSSAPVRVPERLPRLSQSTRHVYIITKASFTAATSRLAKLNAFGATWRPLMQAISSLKTPGARSFCI